ncbi:hypothetical protein, partial [Mycobacteroides abscessus]
ARRGLTWRLFLRHTCILVSKVRSLRDFQGDSDYYFPVQAAQVRNLLGKILTHIEAMNLPPRVEKANKDLVRQSIWDWWSDAMENSTTSAGGCIGPIENIREARTSDDKPNRYVWHTTVGELAPKAPKMFVTYRDKR